MGDMTQQILNADDKELAEVIQAIIRRYGILHSDWEIMFLSLPKYDLAERKNILKSVSDLLVRSEVCDG